MGTADPVRPPLAQLVAVNWSAAAEVLSLYCLKQANDGSGDPSAAASASDRLVTIARYHAEETYAPGAVTYRQALSDEASQLQSCAPDIVAKLDRAAATLPAP